MLENGTAAFDVLASFTSTGLWVGSTLIHGKCQQTLTKEIDKRWMSCNIKGDACSRSSQNEKLKFALKGKIDKFYILFEGSWLYHHSVFL